VEGGPNFIPLGWFYVFIDHLQSRITHTHTPQNTLQLRADRGSRGRWRRWRSPGGGGPGNGAAAWPA
jgi:hypothetical protein